MRISGGTAKGRKIGIRKAFSRKADEDELRPTSAKVREAFFDIVRNRLTGATFLDLYAGTGAIGIEALSRGASRVVFVETNALRIEIIRYLLSELTFRENAELVKMKAYDFLRKGNTRSAKYDIIFLDPPYSSEELTNVIPLISQRDCLKEEGLVVAEHFHKTVLPDVSDRLRLARKYRYGDTVLSLYRQEEA
jgi:16S rRNA (guanine(966)-N(2))-methyltransferase RsmD